MTKPRTSKPDKSRNAPQTARPQAPLQPIRNPRTAKSPAAPSAIRSGSQPGAQINRRAADRLRSGYLWVYASDI